MLICCTLPLRNVCNEHLNIWLDEQTHAQLCGFEKLITIWTCKLHTHRPMSALSHSIRAKQKDGKKPKYLKYKQIGITTSIFQLFQFCCEFFSFDMQKIFALMICVCVSTFNSEKRKKNKKWTFEGERKCST